MNAKTSRANSVLNGRVGKWWRWGIIAVMVLVPFHALLTVWLASQTGHYELWRIWKELLLFVFCLASIGVLYKRPQLTNQLARSWLVRCMVLYLVWTALMTGFGLIFGRVSLAAAAFGFVVNMRLMVFFLTVYIFVAAGGGLKDWRRWVFIPATIVIGLALLQYALPPDFLRHFGYSTATIPAYQTIDNKPDFVRLQSTLRGPNPFGAYLALIIPLLVAAGWYSRKTLQYVFITVAALVALYGSFSRSAWLATAAALAVIAIALVPAPKRRGVIAIGAVVAVVLAAGLFSLRHDDTFQNVIFHTNERSTSQNSSNANRAAALEAGWRDVLAHPLGGGVGSAGPASAHQVGHAAKISENYFLQIGQESGWVGLGLFIAILVLTARGLYRRYQQRPDVLALGLLAALAGLTVVALLSHAWTDDTLVYLFWGLAALALASGSRPGRNSATIKQT